MKNSDHTIFQKLKLFWRPEEAPRCAVADAFSILSAFACRASIKHAAERRPGVDRAISATVVRTADLYY